ncbi:MAG: magnesium transporter CorA family protein [Gammaproteobacteria bacterium]|nr:magnesium transporter CorA family protein [Gammaproteobacteria bacterium]
MKKFMLCHNGTTRTGGSELLEQWKNTPDSWIWVDLFEEPSNDEYMLLVENFHLDNAVIQEAQRMRHPPNFHSFKNYIYLLLKPLDAESDSLDFNTLQLAMFAGKNFLVTRHSKESPYLGKLWSKLEANKEKSSYSPMQVVQLMCHRIAQRYGQILLNLEQRLDEIEDEIFEATTDTLMKELVGYNTGLRKMHRILNYYVDVFGTLRSYLYKHNPEKAVDFDGVFSLVERFNSLSEMYQNVITDLIDGYISLNGHRLNQIMKVLTIVTVIFVPLTLLVGIYGMNFENMPELKSEHGYYILLSIMLGILVVLLGLFRRMRWL